jgi:hypothetical protein
MKWNYRPLSPKPKKEKMTKSIYFVTYRIYKNSNESLKNAICGDVEESHDYWIKTNHYDSEDKMIKFVFDRIADQELLDEIYYSLEDTIDSDGSNYDDKKFFETQKKSAVKIKNKLDDLLSNNSKLKSPTIENKKKVISIVKKYFTEPVFGISYGVVSVK